MLRNYNRFAQMDFEYCSKFKSKEKNYEKEQKGVALGYATTTADGKSVIFRYIDKQQNIITPAHTNLEKAQESFFDILRSKILEQEE